MPAQAVLPGPGSRRAAETAAWLRACLHPPPNFVNEEKGREGEGRGGEGRGGEGKGREGKGREGKGKTFGVDLTRSQVSFVNVSFVNENCFPCDETHVLSQQAQYGHTLYQCQHFCAMWLVMLIQHVKTVYVSAL